MPEPSDLTLEKLNISNRLTKLETCVSIHAEEDSKRWTLVNGHLEKISGLLLGNGKDGALTRLDRLEQSTKQQGWWYSAIGVLGLKSLWDVITRGGR